MSHHTPNIGSLGVSANRKQSSHVVPIPKRSLVSLALPQPVNLPIAGSSTGKQEHAKPKARSNLKSAVRQATHALRPVLVLEELSPRPQEIGHTLLVAVNLACNALSSQNRGSFRACTEVVTGVCVFCCTRRLPVTRTDRNAIVSRRSTRASVSICMTHRSHHRRVV